MTNGNGNNQYTNAWTKEEEQFLRENYTKLNNCEIVKILRNRTASSIFLSFLQ